MTCEICGQTTRPQFKLGPYTINRCLNCGFGRPDPLPTNSDLESFYADYVHSEARDDSTNTRERIRVARALRHWHPTGKTVLDVGCGFGFSLDAAQREGFETFGVEPNPDRVMAARQKGHQVTLGLLSADTFPDRRFDAIILSHVIEHLIDPLPLLKVINKLLTPGGVLYVGTPNYGGLHARVVGAHYSHYCPPEHIGYFTTQSLDKMVQKAGFGLLNMHYYTHWIHTKDFLAYFAYRQFLHPAVWSDPRKRQTDPPPRFTQGRAAFIKKPVYKLITGVSWILRPMVNVLGGDNIEGYWRKN